MIRSSDQQGDSGRSRGGRGGEALGEVVGLGWVRVEPAAAAGGQPSGVLHSSSRTSYFLFLFLKRRTSYFRFYVSGVYVSRGVFSEDSQKRFDDIDTCFILLQECHVLMFSFLCAWGLLLCFHRCIFKRFLNTRYFILIGSKRFDTQSSTERDFTISIV